ncbi:hypothetical protein [Cupriavidus lacunae]|uniref:hypothetical protein n=1 Tax=Cupriavidus lacunae TaxID=2666307 RepID=UPI0031342F20
MAPVEPGLFGLGPVLAVQLALERANWMRSDVERIEINEAFDAITPACLRRLELPEDIVNVEGAPSLTAMPSGTVNLDSPDDKWGHRDFLGPLTSQAARLLPMQAQPLKRSLRPLPVREILPAWRTARFADAPEHSAGTRRNRRGSRFRHGMHYCLRP